MKKSFIVCIMLMIIAITISYANFSAGGIVGDPTGLKFQYDLKSNTFLNADLAYSFLFGLQGATLAGDVWFVNRDLVIINRKSYPLFLGLGFQNRISGIFGGDTYNAFALRGLGGFFIPIFLDNRNRLRLIFQAGPLVQLTSGFKVSGTVGLSLVYRF